MIRHGLDRCCPTAHLFSTQMNVFVRSCQRYARECRRQAVPGQRSKPHGGAGAAGERELVLDQA